MKRKIIEERKESVLTELVGINLSDYIRSSGIEEVKRIQRLCEKRKDFLELSAEIDEKGFAIRTEWKEVSGLNFIGMKAYVKETDQGLEFTEEQPAWVSWLGATLDMEINDDMDWISGDPCTITLYIYFRFTPPTKSCQAILGDDSGQIVDVFVRDGQSFYRWKDGEHECPEEFFAKFTKVATNSKAQCPFGCGPVKRTEIKSHLCDEHKVTCQATVKINEGKNGTIVDDVFIMWVKRGRETRARAFRLNDDIVHNYAIFGQEWGSTSLPIDDLRVPNYLCETSFSGDTVTISLRE